MTPNLGIVIPTHHFRILVHHRQARAHIWSEVGLVDDQDVRLGNAWAIFPRNLVARGDINRIDEEIHQRRAEGQGEIIAALDEHEIAVGEPGERRAGKTR